MDSESVSGLKYPGKAVIEWFRPYLVGWFIQMAASNLRHLMQGWICLEQRVKGYWLVNFPQYGEKDDIAEISILEEDLVLLPNGMDARVNERIKAQFKD